MCIIQSLKQNIAQYLKTHKKSYFLSDNFVNTEQTLAHLGRIKIPNENKFGLFTRGDTGLKRVKFLLSTIVKWEKKDLSDKQILRELCVLYVNKKEPPLGLGNSYFLRDFLIKSIAPALNITQKTITEHAYNTRRALLTEPRQIDDETVIDIYPNQDEVYRQLIREKTIPKIVAISKGKIIIKTFLSGTSLSPNNPSTLKKLTGNFIYDPKVLSIIFSMVSSTYTDRASPNLLKTTTHADQPIP